MYIENEVTSVGLSQTEETAVSGFLGVKPRNFRSYFAQISPLPYTVEFYNPTSKLPVHKLA